MYVRSHLIDFVSSVSHATSLRPSLSVAPFPRRGVVTKTRVEYYLYVHGVGAGVIKPL